MINIYNTGYPIIMTGNAGYMPSITGAVQWNGVTRKLEVSDGARWIPLENNINLHTNQEVENIILWAKDKMQEEDELQNLAETDPTIKDLYEQKKKIDDQLKMVMILKKKEVNETS